MVLYSNYICVTIKEIGGEIVKTHKYWAVGALACMVATFYTGFRGKMKEHKIFAIGAMGCMLFSVLSGYKMISGKGAVKKSEEVKELEYLCNLVTYMRWIVRWFYDSNYI